MGVRVGGLAEHRPILAQSHPRPSPHRPRMRPSQRCDAPGGRRRTKGTAGENPCCGGSARPIIITPVEQNQTKSSLRVPEQSSSRVARAVEVVQYTIEQQLGLRAAYKRGSIILAPHILYERGGALFLDAVVLERDGARPDGDALATFKLSTLRDPVTMMEPIAVARNFDAGDARYSGQVIASVAA